MLYMSVGMCWGVLGCVGVWPWRCCVYSDGTCPLECRLTLNSLPHPLQVIPTPKYAGTLWLMGVFVVIHVNFFIPQTFLLMHEHMVSLIGTVISNEFILDHDSLKAVCIHYHSRIVCHVYWDVWLWPMWVWVHDLCGLHTDGHTYVHMFLWIRTRIVQYLN